MHWILTKRRRSILLTAFIWLWAIPGALAQSANSLRSLGGFGATSTSPMASMRSSSPMIPYAGSFGGFMPYRMASGASSPLSFSPRGGSVLEPTRRPFRLLPMSSGMGVGSGPTSGLRAPLGGRDFMRIGDGLLSQPMGAGNNTNVMPPSFGFPFYQPPSLLSTGSSSSGMSM
jgi:hypothetical protein